MAGRFGDDGGMSAPRGRRAVLDGARRRVEKSLMISEAAAELAAAAALVVEVAGEDPTAEVAALKMALRRYEAIATA